MRNEWVPFARYKELGLIIDESTAPQRTMSPPLYHRCLGSYRRGVGPSIRYRAERRVPRLMPRDWGAYEFNLEDIECWMAWTAAELMRSPGPDLRGL
jgi:hypothetical protein